ncbi:MAG: family 43 glycosylhydrolase, partial [Firmicutes bacterium]|nr:family 43 glycosylhydrolase [Bacillota bacterium]
NETIKKLLSGFISLSMLCSAAAIPVFADGETADDDLIVYITFDEDGVGSSSFEATKGGTVTVYGDVDYVTNYDGTSSALSISSNSASNYLELEDGLLNGCEAATFSFWIKPSSGWAFMTTPDESQTHLYEHYLGMLATSSSFKAENYNNSGARPADIYVYGTYTDWQYVTAVFEADSTKVYINGSLEASDTTSYDIESLFTADASTWIGHGNWGSGEGFAGTMDDFRLYGRALTEDEITDLAADAIAYQKEKLVEEYNCLDIDTQFYANNELSYTENGNDIELTVPSSNQKSAVAIGASYSDGVLTRVVTQDMDLEIGTNTQTLSNVKQSESDTVKAFVWNSTDGMIPVSGDAEEKVFEVTNGGTVTVKTTVTNYLSTERALTFEVLPYDADGQAITGSETEKSSQTVDVMDTVTFEAEVEDTDGVAYYKVLVTDTTDDAAAYWYTGAEYEAGYLPVASVSFPDASPADSAYTTEGVHDPTIFKDPVSGVYYVYSTHNLVYTSNDLIHWTEHDYTSTITVPSDAKAFIEANYSNTTVNTTYWAPDIYYKEGDEYPYWFYLSTSCGLGGRNSVISLVKAKSPGLWDGETKECGIVIASKESSSYNTNAIDANIYTDTDGKTYIIWGSFWKGIHITELDTDTGLAVGVDYTSDATILESCKSFGTRLYSTPGGVFGPEGPYTVHNDETGYTYMFTSYGWLGTNYNIRVARTSKTFTEILSDTSTAHRQLLDYEDRPVGTTYADQVKEGGSLDELWGYKMSGSFQLGDGIEYLGSGHNSVFQDDDGQWYLVQHCRKVADATAFLQVKKILWTEDGWPVISPLVYAGEEEQTIPEEMLYGTWDLASVGHTILADGVTDVSSCTSSDADLPVHSSEIILQADGTLGGDLGTWEFDGDHTVTITFTQDGDTDNYEFYENGDTMTLFALTGYDKDKRESAVILTGTDQNGITSFAKKNNASAQSTKMPAIETTPTTVSTSSIGNPILGFDANGDTMYAGDPAALVDGDTVYIYAGHDTATGDSYVMPEWVCYSSTDMVNWTYHGAVMSATDVSWRSDSTSAWASQVVKYDDKYYLYYCTWGNSSTYNGYQCIGVAVSDSPTGPFTDIGEPLVNGYTMTTENSSRWNDIDPTVWVETVDGEEHRYLAWGNSIFYVCELNEDMTSIKDINEDGEITTDDIKEQEFTNLQTDLGFTEAPWIYRQTDEDGNYTGKYYLFAAFGWREQMGYATSDSMYGPWEFQGIIMEPTATSNTNHPSVIDFDGKTYFIYHNGSLPWGSGYRRVVCVEEMTFNEDGTVNYIDETSAGVSGAEIVRLSTSDGGYVYHENFSNSSSDSDYPLKKQILGGTVSGSTENSYWQIMPGKADETNENYVSIQSYNKPGLYICADGTSVILTQQDTTEDALARKMTFKTVEAINGEDGAVSFESVAKPGYFLTVKSSGTLALSDGTDTNACSFTISDLTADAE